MNQTQELNAATGGGSGLTDLLGGKETIKLYAIDYGDGQLACETLEAANHHAAEINKKIKENFPADEQWECRVEEWVGSAELHAANLLYLKDQ